MALRLLLTSLGRAVLAMSVGLTRVVVAVPLAWGARLVDGTRRRRRYRGADDQSHTEKPAHRELKRLPGDACDDVSHERSPQLQYRPTSELRHTGDPVNGA